jgi:uncharacterized delta-60 repeat protein
MKKCSFIFAVTLLLNANLLNAQGGSLDLTFDADGKVTTSIGTFNDEARAIKIQNDGKIVVAGKSFNGTNYDFAVVRYNTNGSLDNSFGTGGIVTTAIGIQDDKATCLAIQADGKIVVGGNSFQATVQAAVDFTAIVRYNSDGTLDSTFDTDGIVLNTIVPNMEYYYQNQYTNGIAIQADGKIVATGGYYFGNNFGWYISRFNPNGSLDNTFDADGIAGYQISPYDDMGNAIAVQNNGKIVVAGYHYINNNSETDIFLTRWSEEGNCDLNFTSNETPLGIVTHPIVGNFSEFANALAIQDDGKILVAIQTDNTFYDFVVARYDISGILDNSFGTGGIVVTDFGSSTDFANPTGIALQPNGKIVVIGYRNVGIDLNFALARYNNDGSIDDNFGENGIVTTDFGGPGNDQAFAVAIQSDNKIVVAGSSYESQNSIALARYVDKDISTSIAENNSYSNITVSPNPFSSSTTFRNKNEFQQASFNLYNALGQQVLQFNNINHNEFSIGRNDLPAGIYFYKIIQENKVLKADKVLIVD